MGVISEENPCNVCSRKYCDDCVLERMCNKCYECQAYKCFLNYEGSCMLSLYDDCGYRRECDEDSR